MLFNSISFFLFLPLVFSLYWFAFHRSLKLQNVLILVASYFFYGWWSWKFMGMLALTTILDYLYGFGVASENPRKSRFFLWLSVLNNLGILAAFKYYNFFLEQFQKGFSTLGLEFNPTLLNVALPIGISFYTFHGMSYVFDIYRKRQAPISNFVDYGVFVSFFPLLVAGPIERASHLLPQIQQPRTFSRQQAVEGCRLILWGLVKKVVIADTLAVTVDIIFADYANMSGATLLIGVIGFAFQIYGDFSGYSDIALGTAKLFGFELLSNFRFPYFSRNLAEFWKRWHISLSSWFRDYLYIPLGGSKQGKWKAVRNTFIIFLVSGFWHGASWNFVAWGAIHAAGFLPLLLFKSNKDYTGNTAGDRRVLPTGKELFQITATFAFVCFGWIFFRIASMRTIYDFLSQMWSSLLSGPTTFFQTMYGLDMFPYIIFLVGADWWLRHNERILRRPPGGLLTYAVATLTVLYFLFGSDESSSFIYFQF